MVQNMFNAKNAGPGIGVILVLHRNMAVEEQVDIIAKNVGLVLLKFFY